MQEQMFTRNTIIRLFIVFGLVGLIAGFIPFRQYQPLFANLLPNSEEQAQ